MSKLHMEGRNCLKDFLGEDLTSVEDLLNHARRLLGAAIDQHASEGYWMRTFLTDAKKAIDLAYVAVGGEHDAKMRQKFGPPQEE